MSVEILKNIETAFKTVIESAIAASADPELSSISVYAYHIDEGEKVLPQVSVFASNALDEEAPGRKFYNVPVSFASETHLPADENRAIVSKLDALIFDAVTTDSVGNEVESPLVLIGLHLDDGTTATGGEDGNATENTQSEFHQYVVHIVDATDMTTTT